MRAEFCERGSRWRGTAVSRRRTCSPQEPTRPGRRGLRSLSPPRAAARRARLLPLGSSACLASLRSAAAKLEDGAAWADSVLLLAGLPLGTSAPLSGEGVRGLTVAVVLVAVESIPSEGDLGSWLMPETGKEEPEVTQRAGGPSTRAGEGAPRGASEQHAGTGTGADAGGPGRTGKTEDRQRRRESRAAGRPAPPTHSQSVKCTQDPVTTDARRHLRPHAGGATRWGLVSSLQQGPGGRERPQQRGGRRPQSYSPLRFLPPPPF